MKMFRLLLLLLAFVLFLLAGLGVNHPKYNFIGWGLALYVLAGLLPEFV
jgi:hypothetical protein